MAEWLFSPVVDKLINTGFEYLQNKFTWHTHMKKALERLRDNHPKIQAFVSNARRAQIIDQNSALNKWLWQLRDAIDEADDLLDDFEYTKHQEQLDRNKEENKDRSYITSIFNTAKRLCVGNKDPLKSKPDFNRLEEVVHKLDIILAEATSFLHLLENEKQEQREQQVELHKTRETGSLPKNDLIGRGKDKNSVTQWLRKPSNEEPQTHGTTTALYSNISVLSIVGHGGMGKTTLLQHIYQHEITKEFDLKMWICVSENFDVKKVMTDMLECLQKKRPSLESLHALQESLQSEVMSKKFLLVLDDIWDDKEEEVVLLSKWGDVLSPLAYGGLESKILITTRTDSVASMIAKVIGKKKEALRLEGLKQDECLQLLTTHAFADTENPDDHKKLRSIAGELVKKLSGSPLAAKVMGGVLNSSLDERHWRNVLNNSLGLDGIFPILKLSYTFLPEHLQSCFSFCSIFRQDRFFNKVDLVQMWIAVGFIQPSHIQGENLTLEDIGECYFDVLIKKSFFDEVFYQGEYYGYKMHDLLNELAQSVSTQECFRFVGDEKLLLGIPETIRHLSVVTSNLEVLKKIGRFKNLRTLFITCYNQGIVDVLDEMLKVTRSIRLLYIDDHKLEMIPENIGYLLHLRYLRFDFSNIRLLPRSLSSLYHLQFIIFYKDSLRNGPNYFPPTIRDMNNLSNLRYLSKGQLNFPGIGKLQFLQELDRFCIKNKIGYRIEELEYMNELRSIEIMNLKKVRDAQEACKAKLCDKRKLTKLSLNWGNIFSRDEQRDNADRDSDERVLDNLQPHNYLKTLHLSNYKGSRSAIWMNETHLISNLEEIYLCSCLQWEILPPFGQLPFLKLLCLENMSKVKRLENKFHGNDMCCVFPSLEIIYLRNLEALVDWFDASVVDSLFPRLTKLYLENCPNLQELPYLPPKLESLNIHNIGWRTLNSCNISKSIPLKKTLEVSWCGNLTSISLAGEIGKLTLLITLCPNLISLVEHQEVVLDDLILNDLSVLQMEPLRSSNSIRSLIIENNDELVSFPLEAEQWLLQVSSSLRELQFRNLKSLRSLPSSLASLSSLEILIVDRLPQLRELPDLPPSYKKLIIRDCDGHLMEGLS